MSNDTKVITGLTIVAVVVIALLVWLAGRNPSSSRYLPTAVNQSAGSGDYQVGGLVNDGDYQDGSADAKVTLVEFADFECPICKVVYPVVAGLRDKFSTSDLRLVFRLTPLWEIHSEALASARAAQAAQNQGKFAEYAAALFDNQDSLSDSLYVNLANQFSLNIDQFNTDRQSDTTAWRASRARNYMQQQGWELATPTIVINGQKYDGARTTDALSAAIQAAMK